MAATRMAYIDWKKFDENTVLENRKEYMLCIPHDGEAVLEFAQYFDKGSVIDVKMADGKAPEGKEPTAEEQLLKTLFGASKPFIVPEDGFYVLTADYGVDEAECNGSFEGCREQAVCFGNRHGWSGDEGAIPVYWAEKPLLPEGLAYEKTAERNHLEKEEEAYQKAWDDIESDMWHRSVYRAFCGTAKPGDGCVDCQIGQAVYALSPYNTAVTILNAANMVRAMVKVPEEAFIKAIESVESEAKKNGSESALTVFKEFCDRNGLPEYLRSLIVPYVDYLREDEDDFYFCRNRILKEGGVQSLNIPGVLQRAWAEHQLPCRVGRLVKLVRIGAPDIITSNELRVLVGCLIANRNSGRIVCVGPEFDAMYGVMPDGTRGSRHCDHGDKELQLMQEVQDEPDDESESEDGAEVMDAPEEVVRMLNLDTEAAEEAASENEKAVIGVDYPWFAVVPAPNFMMRKCLYVLWDNTNVAYYRDEDGTIAGFAKWNAAKEKSEELGRIASAQADFEDAESST